MLIPVVGFDPSLRNWGIARGNLDLVTGVLQDISLELVQSVDPTGMTVRQNSKDLSLAEQLAKPAMLAASTAKVIFVETPVGSQSSCAMASYGVCVGILGSIRATGIPLIEVTPYEVKKHFTGDKLATKTQMIQAAKDFYPDVVFPKAASKAEHLADALASIHAGVLTPQFQQLMRLFKSI